MYKRQGVTVNRHSRASGSSDEEAATSLRKSASRTVLRRGGRPAVTLTSASELYPGFIALRRLCGRPHRSRERRSGNFWVIRTRIRATATPPLGGLERHSAQRLIGNFAQPYLQPVIAAALSLDKKECDRILPRPGAGIAPPVVEGK